MVYHGPSRGCRRCRNRRIKCDRAHPACKNCSRRQEDCPGYGDLFDNVHRSENQAVRRRSEKENGNGATPSPNLGGSTSNCDTISRRSPTASPKPTATASIKISSRWTVYSAVHEWPAKGSSKRYNASASSIPGALEQSPQETAICFYFRHYGGTSIDPEASSGFNQLWPPMYLRATANSPLRLATAAVTVNIAMIWSAQGCDARPARGLFTKAVAAARVALYDSSQSLTSETLMSILIFDLYDALTLHYAPTSLEYGKHKHGALAMIKSRGLANLATAQDRTLVGAVRHTLLPYLLCSRKPFPEELDYVFDHPSLNNTKASHLDMISARLSRLYSRVWTLHLDRNIERNFEELRASYEEVIINALNLENYLLQWQASITNPDWLSEYVARGSVVESIQNAGFYGTRCSLWVDLTYGSIWVLFTIRYIFTLQIIRQCFADEASLLDKPEYHELLPRIDTKIQDLVDFVCEAIPFFLGDTVTPKNPVQSTSINFPSTVRQNDKTGLYEPVPSLGSNHQKRAAASSGWILFPHLNNLWRFAEPEDDAVPIILREGQLDWIKDQVRSLQMIYLFCEPVWFKRAPVTLSEPLVM